MARKPNVGTQPKQALKPGSATASAARSTRLILFLLLLGGALAVLFHKGFEPYQVHFSLDEPLGWLKADASRAPGTCAGHWCDFGWIGAEIPAASPCVSIFLASIFPPELLLKFYAPFTLLLLGFSAWLMFRELGFGRQVCVLGGIAAGLNTMFLSVACWGLGRWTVAFAMIFLAIAALATKSIRQSWAKAIFAGCAVGLNVIEGFDVGAINAPFVAIFAVFVVSLEERPAISKLWKCIWMPALIALSAGIIAAHCVKNMVGTQIEGVAGVAQDARSKQQRWGFNTMWSIPKLETLRVIIPGIFGDRLVDHITSEDRSSAYWGRVGEETRLQDMMSDDPQVRTNAARELGAAPKVLKVLAGPDEKARATIIESFKPKVMRRHNYCAEYAGVLVSVFAIFAIMGAFRKSDSTWRLPERKAIWFWFAIALFSLLAAWGRHGFVYRWLYELPYASTIRNPMKFMHPFHIAWLILAGYGMEYLRRLYLPTPVGSSGSKTDLFAKGWTVGLSAALAVSVVSLALLLTHKDQLADFINRQGFNPELARQIASFCCTEVIWFVVLLAAATAIMISIFRGIWRDRTFPWPWLLIGALIIFDLGRADAPWVYYFSWKEKYSPNPVMEVLSDHPYEHRVASKISPLGDSGFPGEKNFYTMCAWWSQNDFPWRNIQTLDIAQSSRLPILDRDYIMTFLPRGRDWSRPARLWMLTNTRYLLASMEALKELQTSTGADGPAFRLHTRLDMGRKPFVRTFQDFGDLTVAQDPNGDWALIEFVNVLPRAKLYSHWEIPADDHTALNTLASKQFNPAQTVLISKETPIATSSSSAGNAGDVAITGYAPKRIRLHAKANTPAVLLLNDRIAPGWTVSVDQKPAQLLRCNDIMRGVLVSVGEHDVEFRFQPPLLTLYISLAGFITVAGLGLYLFLRKKSPIDAR